MTRKYGVLMAVLFTGCATSTALGPQGESHLQVFDPVSGVLMTEFRLVDGRACPAAADEIKRRVKPHGSLKVTCSANAEASQLPFRYTVRFAATEQQSDFHFRTLDMCEKAEQSMDRTAATVTTSCARK